MCLPREPCPDESANRPPVPPGIKAPPGSTPAPGGKVAAAAGEDEAAPVMSPELAMLMRVREVAAAGEEEAPAARFREEPMLMRMGEAMYVCVSDICVRLQLFIIYSLFTHYLLII